MRHGTWGCVAVWLVALVVGCGGKGSTGDTRLRMTTLEYPATEGSRELRPLLRLAACKVMGLDYEWEETVGPDGKGREVVMVGDLAERRARERVLGEKARASGTVEAYKALLDGDAALVLVTRPPTEAELRLARERGIEIDAEPVGFDALVFLVHRDSPVGGLRVRQVREVYGGRITDWSELGGTHMPIAAHRRNRGAPSEALMQRMVMKGEPMAELPEDRLVHTLEGPVGSVGLKNGTLSYTRLPNARHQSETERVRLAAVDGVRPDSEQIRSRSYPLAAEVYVATKKASQDMEGTVGIRLRRWLSGHGQRVVEEAGFAAVRGDASAQR